MYMYVQLASRTLRVACTCDDTCAVSVWTVCNSPRPIYDMMSFAHSVCVYGCVLTQRVVLCILRVYWEPRGVAIVLCMALAACLERPCAPGVQINLWIHQSRPPFSGLV